MVIDTVSCGNSLVGNGYLNQNASITKHHYFEQEITEL